MTKLRGYKSDRVPYVRFQQKKQEFGQFCAKVHLLYLRLILYISLIGPFYIFDLALSHYYLFLQMDISTAYKNTLMGMMILTGAMNTIAYRYQNRQMVYEGAYYKLFFHPYMQATTMFLGQALCYILFIIQKRRDPDAYKMKQLDAKSKGLQLKCNPLYIAIPAFCDFLSTTMQYIALNFIAGSVWQMLRGGVIVTTAIFSKFFLKMQPKKNHYFGCAFAILGILIVGASNIIFAPKHDSSSNGPDPKVAVVGYILVIISLFTNGFMFVFEEKLFQKYHLEPFQIVGIEGLWGLSFYAVVLPAITFIPCSFGLESCVFSQTSFPYIQRPDQYFREAGHSWSLVLFIILGVFSIAGFNICGVSVTKYINALARSLADVTRTAVIWIIGIIVTVTAGVNYPNYVWELVSPGAIILQFIGFVILVFGNLIYNKILKIPFLVGPIEDEKLIQSHETLGVSLQHQQEHDD